MVRFQKVRWYVKYEMIKQVFLDYVCLEPWVQECELHATTRPRAPPRSAPC